MVIDTSAIIAVLLGESEADKLIRMISQSQENIMSSFSVLEAGIVMEAKKGEAGSSEFDLFIQKAGIKVFPVDPEQVVLARLAWRKYGKGRHPAGLNIGDCCSYALAKQTNSALLFKGNDFDKTDILVCRY